MRIYRGKREDNNEWVYGCFYKCKQRTSSQKESSYISLLDSEEYGYNANYFIVNDESVGQCSLVKDKNGVDMFEGDIVAGALSWLEHKKYGIVAFREGSFGLLWYRGKIEQFTPFAHLCNVEYEVIGNIVDDVNFLFKEVLPNETN